MRGRPRLPVLAGAVLAGLVCISAATAGWSASASAGPQTVAAGSIAAPAALSATVNCVLNTSLSVNLTWPAPAAATAYDVLRATASGGPYTTIGSPATTSFVDSTAAPQTAYYYVVTAKRGAWTSPPSPQAAVTTPRLQSCR